MKISNKSLLYRLGAYSENPLVFLEGKNLQTRYNPKDLCHFTRLLTGGLILIMTGIFIAVFLVLSVVSALLTLANLFGWLPYISGNAAALGFITWLIVLGSLLCYFWHVAEKYLKAKGQERRKARREQRQRNEVEEFTKVSKILKSIVKFHNEKVCVRIEAK